MSHGGSSEVASFFDAGELSHDAFLGGRLVLGQPRKGYRAATDPVFLAAATPAKPGDAVLELGIGTGAATLCLARRVGGLLLSGLELNPEYLELACENAAANSVEVVLHLGDVATPPVALRQQSFDHVILNPPFFDAKASPSSIPGRDLARREAGPDLAAWIACALARLRPGGWLCMIHRVERLPEILAEIGSNAGDVSVMPLAARAGRPAKRIVLRARKGSRGGFRLLAPLVLHAGAAHHSDGDDYTPAASAILRDAGPLNFEENCG